MSKRVQFFSMYSISNSGCDTILFSLYHQPNGWLLFHFSYRFHTTFITVCEFRKSHFSHFNKLLQDQKSGNKTKFGRNGVENMLEQSFILQ